MENETNNVCSFKVKKCLQCGAETNPADNKEFYCSQCGAPVLNKCSNYNCQEMLNGDAKFCKYCGNTSIFYNYGLFDNTNSFSPDYTDDLPF